MTESAAPSRLESFTRFFKKSDERAKPYSPDVATAEPGVQAQKLKEGERPTLNGARVAVERMLRVDPQEVTSLTELQDNFGDLHLALGPLLYSQMSLTPPEYNRDGISDVSFQWKNDQGDPIFLDLLYQTGLNKLNERQIKSRMVTHPPISVRFARTHTEGTEVSDAHIHLDFPDYSAPDESYQRIRVAYESKDSAQYVPPEGGRSPFNLGTNPSKIRGQVTIREGDRDSDHRKEEFQLVAVGLQDLLRNLRDRNASSAHLKGTKPWYRKLF